MRRYLTIESARFIFPAVSLGLSEVHRSLLILKESKLLRFSLFRILIALCSNFKMRVLFQEGRIETSKFKSEGNIF